MYLMSAEGYKNAKSDFLPKTGKIWGVSIRDIGNGLGVTNISDLVLKEIYGICETKYPTKEQVNEYKMSKREFYKKIYKLSEHELNTKS